MATFRAYFDLSKLTVDKHPQGSHYVEVQSGMPGSAPVKVHLFDDNGVFYVFLNETNPIVHSTLAARITKVSSEDRLPFNLHFASLSSGIYRGGKGDGCTAEVITIPGNKGGIEKLVKITADKIGALRKFRAALLAGKLTPRVSFEKREQGAVH